MKKAYEVIGNYNKYQIKISILISIAFPFLTMYSLLYPFFTKVPEFDCISKEKSNFTKEDYFPCPYNSSLCSQTDYIFIKNKEKSIDNWAYKFDLFCEREYLSPLVSTSFFLGSMISSVTIGHLPDIYGRCKIYKILIYLSIFCFLNLLFPLGPFNISFIYFVGGILSFGSTIPPLLVVEFLPRERIGVVQGMINASYPVMGILVSLFYFFINSYKILCSFFVFGLVIIAFYCQKYLYESPKWLYSKKKIDELLLVYKNISIFNGTQKKWENYYNQNKDSIFIEEGVENQNNYNKDNKSNNDDKKTYTFFEVLKYKSQRKKTFMIIYLYFASSFCYYGVLLNLAILKGNFYANSIMIFLAISIASFFSASLIDIYGRLNVLKYSILFGAIFLLIFPYIKSNLILCFILFLSMIGYNAHYSIIPCFISESFPTCIRSLMVNYTKFFSRFGPLLVPLISQKFRGNENNLFIIIGFISFVFCFFLEETKGKELEDRIPEEVNKDTFLSSY